MYSLAALSLTNTKVYVWTHESIGYLKMYISQWDGTEIAPCVLPCPKTQEHQSTSVDSWVHRVSENGHQLFGRGNSQLAMRRRATSSRRWHQSPRSRSHIQRRADVGSRSQAAQSATLPLQRGLGQWTQSVLASSLDRRQGDPRQMAEIRKLRVNLQLLKSN